MSNKTIYMNETLKILDKKTPRGQFGKALGRMIHRFQLIMELTQLPVLSQIEKDLLVEALGEREISSLLIRYLHEAVLECKRGSVEERKALSRKISALSNAERILLYEAMGL